MGPGATVLPPCGYAWNAPLHMLLWVGHCVANCDAKQIIFCLRLHWKRFWRLWTLYKLFTAEMPGNILRSSDGLLLLRNRPLDTYITKHGKQPMLNHPCNRYLTPLMQSLTVNSLGHTFLPWAPTPWNHFILFTYFLSFHCMPQLKTKICKREEMEEYYIPCLLISTSHQFFLRELHVLC